MQLAALSLQGRQDVAAFIAEFAGDDRFIVDYLADEVLDRQTAEIRRFLLHTSILGPLTGPLCDAVTGETTGKATLEALERANLFVVRSTTVASGTATTTCSPTSCPSACSTRSRVSWPCCTGGRVTGTSATASEPRPSPTPWRPRTSRALRSRRAGGPADAPGATGGDAAGVVRSAPERGVHESPRADHGEGRCTDGEWQVRRRRGVARSGRRLDGRRMHRSDGSSSTRPSSLGSRRRWRCTRRTGPPDRRHRGDDLARQSRPRSCS